MPSSQVCNHARHGSTHSWWRHGGHGKPLAALPNRFSNRLLAILRPSAWPFSCPGCGLTPYPSPRTSRAQLLPLMRSSSLPNRSRLPNGNTVPGREHRRHRNPSSRGRPCRFQPPVLTSGSIGQMDLGLDRVVGGSADALTKQESGRRPL